MRPVLSDNAPRFPYSAKGSVESFFLRMNHPSEPRALWLKATVLVSDEGGPVAEAWAASFGPDRCFAVKKTVPLGDAVFHGGGTIGTPVRIEIAGCTWDLTPEGGSVQGQLGDGGDAIAWDLTFSAANGIGRPMCPYPTRRMVTGRFPKFKLLTPLPVLMFSGRLSGRDVAGWTGSQGHNWGREHAREYAWGQVVFPESAAGPAVFAEGFTGRIRLGRVTTPPLSVLIVRRGDREYRFDRVFALWRQRVELRGTRGADRDRTWRLRIRGEVGTAEIAMECDERRMVCLGYRDPSGELALCLNSKVARATLRVDPAEGEPFACETADGAALELLRRSPDPVFDTFV